MASALKGDVPFDAGMIALYRNNLEMAVKKFNQYLEEKDFEMLAASFRQVAEAHGIEDVGLDERTGKIFEILMGVANMLDASLVFKPKKFLRHERLAKQKT